MSLNPLSSFSFHHKQNLHILSFTLISLGILSLSSFWLLCSLRWFSFMFCAMNCEKPAIYLIIHSNSWNVYPLLALSYWLQGMKIEEKHFISACCVHWLLSKDIIGNTENLYVYQMGQDEAEKTGARKADIKKHAPASLCCFGKCVFLWTLII